ncbi:MAG: hypothetical protein CMQ22_03965 [Gammaproteobacteria bacterium]|nr:hypothetical protein [Gammaproteobacteria bacterium]
MASAIATSLEYLVEKLGDPQAQIYQHLYQQYPEVLPLFVLDTDGGVRGAMLQTTLETILDYATHNRLDHVSLAAWRSHHVGYEVDAELFARFFVIIRDCAKDALGCEWSLDMEIAWAELIRQVEASEEA